MKKEFRRTATKGFILSGIHHATKRPVTFNVSHIPSAIPADGLKSYLLIKYGIVNPSITNLL